MSCCWVLCLEKGTWHIQGSVSACGLHSELLCSCCRNQGSPLTRSFEYLDLPGRSSRLLMSGLSPSLCISGTHMFWMRHTSLSMLPFLHSSICKRSFSISAFTFLTNLQVLNPIQCHAELYHWFPWNQRSFVFNVWIIKVCWRPFVHHTC